MLLRHHVLRLIFLYFHSTTTAPDVLSLLFSEFISNMSTHRQYFPQPEDETGAAKALMRLQDTYQLDSEAFSRGKLPGNHESQDHSKTWHNYSFKDRVEWNVCVCMCAQYK